jgi:hypothetical protein
VKRALAGLLLTAACGTTVPLAQTTAGPGDGLGGPDATVPAGPGLGTGVATQPDQTAGRQPADAGNGAATAAPGQSGGALPTGSGAAAATQLGRGVTARTIRIGVAYQANLDAANRALGGGKITSGDQLGEVDLLVADINAHGGLGGRKLVLDAFAYDAQSTQPYAVQDQVACAHFTQDTRVFAVVGAGLTQTFQECMEKAGTAVVGADIVRFDAADFRRYPHYFDVQEMDLERLATALADELGDDGWSGGWNATLGRPAKAKAKVGVVAFDRPRYTAAVRDVLLPRLRAKGLAVDDADVVFVSEPTSQSDIGPAATQVQNAVLRFGHDGVTHVVLLDTHGGITQVFLNVADGQHYFPRYGMESGSGTQALLDGGVIRASQLAGAKGLGWIPALDLPSAANPDNGRWSSDDRRHCVSLMKAGGQAFTSTNAESIALLYCDQLWLLDRSLDTIPTTPTLAAFTSAVERLGSGAPDASLGAASYAPGKHVAVARGVEWSFDGSCGCMTYGRARALR